MKGNKLRSCVNLDRLARTIAITATAGICGSYSSIMPRAAPETRDTLRAFLAKRGRYGKHR